MTKKVLVDIYIIPHNFSKKLKKLMIFSKIWKMDFYDISMDFYKSIHIEVPLKFFFGFYAIFI